MGEVTIEIDIDKTYIEKTDIDESHKPHNGKPVYRIVISPDKKYVITYSEEDNSIVGWNGDIEEGKLNLDYTVQTFKTSGEIRSLFVTDDKKLFFNSSDNESK